ncbi:patatin-like phospholipase family protein [Fodinibius sediminis]|uniref:NTE family protein n=1 Tax=Fodinibius sediminis TaxID=1214077 RepID=A0A521AF76_9BACT|nr:patatin-like phospholipase family protein [Fodinibius sediminis]SMO33432.1 NTE family protein [Fodinibius sediminis]
MPDSTKKIALVLSGGGAKGAFQVGALDTFYNHGYEFDLLSGVSVGALNGSMIATRQFEQLQELWDALQKSDVLRTRSITDVIQQFVLYKIGFSRHPRGLHGLEPLKRLLSSHLFGKEIRIPFHFGFVSLESGHYVKATVRQDGHKIDEDDILRIMASSAIPVQFEPVDFYNQTLVDGGIRNISPIAEILPYNPDEIVIIPTEPLDGRQEKAEVDDILQIAKRTVEVMLDEIFIEDIKRFVQINRLVGQAARQGALLEKPNGMAYKYIDSQIVAPVETLGDSLDFGEDILQERYERGKRRAEKILNQSDDLDV